MTEQAAPQSQTPHRQLIGEISKLLAPLGYEVVHLEAQTHREKVLRLFIDHLESSARGVGIQDCVKVTKALDEPLESLPEIDAIFHGPYELEVSSPGIDRPLRTPRDFERFAGSEVRVHVFRPLSAEELGSADYKEKNPRQKNFIGKLVGMRDNNVILEIQLAVKAPKKTEEVKLPLPLISKANLEPDFEAAPDFKNAPDLKSAVDKPQNKMQKREL